MVESRTARMRLVQWSSGTDSPQRVDFNETFLNIETLAAIDQQGTLNDRPNPSKAGMYYFATDTGTLYRSDGTSWAVVGASVLSQLVRPARTDAVAHTVQGLASQTADLKRILNSANVIYQRVRSNGDFIHGPLRVSQAGRTTTGTETVPTNSATTVDNASSSMWGLTLSNTTGNTAGFLRGLRGGSEVFSISSTGVITTPAVSLTSEPSSNSHATTKKYVDDKIGSTVYPLDGPQLSGVLPVAKGGTGGTTQATARSGIGAAASATSIATGAGLTGGGNLTASRTLSVVFPTSGGTRNGATMGTSDVAARMDHQHSLAGADIVGTLPVAQGGTGGTTEASARTGIGAAASATTFTAGTGLSGGGTLGANRTFNVVFAGSGTANSAARSDHTHDINSSSITGALSVAGGGTGRTSITAGNYVIGAGTTGVSSKTPAQVLADIGAATSGHGHALTDANITGTLPVAQGGTGATTAAAARSSLAVPVNTTAINTGNGLTGGGNLTASRTLSVQFAGSGSANTVARSDHKHAFSEILERLSNDQLPAVTIIPKGTNLDSYTSDGVFYQNTQNDIAADYASENYPEKTAGLLVVYSGSSMVHQFYQTYTLSSPKLYTRTKYNSAWGAWTRMADVDDISALANVYAAKSHKHSLSSSDITGTLPLNQGGTGATTAASARSALAVPSTSVSMRAGAGLSGGGTLASSRTFQVVFEGSGTKDSAARSDHTHTSLDSAGGRLYFHATTGALYHFAGSTRVFTAGSDGSFSLDTAGVSISSSGTISGAKMSWNDITSKPSTYAPSSHSHSLSSSDITGTLPVNQGGTGATTASAARSNIDAAYVSRQIIAGVGLTGGGTLAANRTLSVVFPSLSFTIDGSSTGTSDIAARYNHKHNLTGTYIEGNLPWEKNSIPISLSTEDLDTLTDTAVYHQGANANATSARNYPSAVAGRLEVTNVGMMTYQTYTDYTYNGGVWRRTKYGSNAWYGWKRMAEVGSDIDPLATRVGELEPSIATLALPSTSKWAGHGYRPQIIREGKRRTLRGRVSPTGASFAQKGGTNYLFNLPAMDRPSATIGGIGQISGFASPGFARIEIGNAGVPAGDVLAGTSNDTSWIGVDGISWYVD